MQKADLFKRAENSSYWQLLGMKVLWAENGKAKMILPVSDKHLQLFGVVHGGAIASLMDSAVGVAVNSCLGPDGKAATVEMNVNYLAPVDEGKLVAEAEVIQKGKRIMVGTVNVTDGNGRPVACGRATYIVNRA